MLDTLWRTIVVASEVRYNLRTVCIQKGRLDNFADGSGPKTPRTKRAKIRYFSIYALGQ